MMSADETARVTREYYNSSDADSFYATVWGGEDIHIGLYESGNDPIFDASRRTVEKMASLLPSFHSESRVLDLGAGYGGSSRFLVQRFGCRAACLNLSEVQNQTNRERNRQAGLDQRINVIDGSFEDLSFSPEAQFDVVWSQDALLHSGNREKVLTEIHRVLKPAGLFVFTDPMQSDDCPSESLAPVLERIHLKSLGSPGFYGGIAEKLGWHRLEWLDLSEQLPNHYSRVLEEVCARESQLVQVCSSEYLQRMKAGLRHWIEAGRAHRLKWGIFLFRK